MSTTTMGVKLDPETRERIKKLSVVKNRSSHWLMKDAITRYLDAEEAHEQERVEDETRYQRYLDTGTHITNQDMMNWLDDLASSAADQGK